MSGGSGIDPAPSDPRRPAGRDHAPRDPGPQVAGEEPVDPEEPVSDADRRMADILAAGGRVSSVASSAGSDGIGLDEDMQGRLAALDFVDSLVGVDLGMPERIGDYEVRGLLGRGGMGAVFDAWQVSLEREVALKVLAPAFSQDPGMRSRFRTEARATASLHHQHIVPVFDYGESGGMMFFAMEKVRGISLDKHISAQKRAHEAGRSDQPGLLPPREAARRFAGVADALAHAHRRRLLHRDVKPGNILVHDDGTLALADFGLSKVLGDASVKLSSAGGFMGTLHYASPEQALGAELGPPSDLYSLGVALFETVTGRLPRHARSTESMLQEILHGTPRRLREVMRDAPKDLDAVLEKLMSREPRDRYQDGEQLARDLQRIGDGEPVAIRRRSWLNRTWRKARANPVLTAAVVTVAVLVVLTLLLMRGISLERDAKQAERHRTLLTEAREDARLEDGPPAGPPGLLAGMLGWELPDVPGGQQVLEKLAASAAVAPGDPAPEELAAAYRADVDSRLRELLASGGGHAALPELDGRIRELRGRYNSGDAAAELLLHQAYLLRALARFTPAAADVDEARVDLELARFLRPGALLPTLLSSLVGLYQGEPLPSVLAQCEDRLQRVADPEVATAARQVMGALLVAAAGVWSPEQQSWLPLAGGWALRLEVHRAGCRMLPGGEPPRPGAPGPGCCGVEARLLDLESRLLRGEGGQPDRLLEDARKVLRDECAPASPLSRHALVLDALEEWRQQPGAQIQLDTRDPERAAAALQVLWRLLRGQQSGWLPALWSLAGQLTRMPKPPVAALAVRACLARELSMDGRDGPGAGQVRVDPEAALEQATAWVMAAPEDPEARWCRLAAAVQVGSAEALAIAENETLAAVSRELRRETALARAVQEWDSAAVALATRRPLLEDALRIRDAYAALQR